METVIRLNERVICWVSTKTRSHLLCDSDIMAHVRGFHLLSEIKDVIANATSQEPVVVLGSEETSMTIPTIMWKGSTADKRILWFRQLSRLMVSKKGIREQSAKDKASAQARAYEDIALTVQNLRRSHKSSKEMERDRLDLVFWPSRGRTDANRE